MTRVRYSINLDEDFELYGIDPNEDLDDWSFLDAKPEPIPEKTDEEKELFEQLLKPTLASEEIDRDIHERLKNLIGETTKLIDENKNDPIIREAKADKVQEQIQELPSTPDEERKRLSTPEYVQANRVRNIVKSLLDTTEKAEDISEFIEDITKSDRIDPNTIEVPENHYFVPAVRLLPALQTIPIETPASKEPENTTSQKTSSRLENKTQEKTETKTEKQQEPQKKNFFGRYVKKLTEPKAVLKSLDETDRLSNQFQEERRRREEEAAKEAERKQKELEEQSQKFFLALQKEQERREKMPAQIAEFQKKLSEKIAEQAPQKKPVVVVELITEHQKLIKTKTHESKTFLSNLNKNLAVKIKAALVKKQQKKKAKALIKIAIFLKFVKSMLLQKKAKKFLAAFCFHSWQKKFNVKMQAKAAAQKAKEEEERKLRKMKEDAKKVENAKKSFAAARIQFIVRKYLKILAAKEKKRKEKEAFIAAQRRAKEEERRKRMAEMPDVADIDDSWINKYEKVSDSDFDDFLDGLAEPVQQPAPQTNESEIIMDAGSVPVSANFDAEKFGVRSSITEPADEKSQMDRVRAEIEKRLKQKKQEAARQSQNSQNMKSNLRDSQNSNLRASQNSSNSQNTANSQSQEGGDDHQLTAETMALMRKAAQHRRHNGSSSANRSGGNSATRQSGGQMTWAPRAAVMRQNNTRAQRLKKLSKVWFDGHRREEDEGEN